YGRGLPRETVLARGIAGNGKDDPGPGRLLAQGPELSACGLRSVCLLPTPIRPGPSPITGPAFGPPPARLRCHDDQPAHRRSFRFGAAAAPISVSPLQSQPGATQQPPDFG